MARPTAWAPKVAALIKSGNSSGALLQIKAAPTVKDLQQLRVLLATDNLLAKNRNIDEATSDQIAALFCPQVAPRTLIRCYCIFKEITMLFAATTLVKSKVTSATLAIGAAFCAGLVVSPATEHVLSLAHAQAVPLVAAVIDIGSLKEADLPTTPNPDLRAKTLVVTDNATLGVQMGNVGKHIHSKSDEIQYIVEGTGTAWLGDKKIDLKPGMLIVIPKGTAHAGTVETAGRFKAIAIKIPPQVSGDTTFVQ